MENAPAKALSRNAESQFQRAKYPSDNGYERNQMKERQRYK